MRKKLGKKGHEQRVTPKKKQKGKCRKKSFCSSFNLDPLFSLVRKKDRIRQKGNKEERGHPWIDKGDIGILPRT